MFNFKKWTVASLLAGALMLGVAASSAQAQFNPGFTYRFYYNTNGLPTNLQLRTSNLNPRYMGYVANQQAYLAYQNPFVRQALYNQALYNQALYNQALYNQALLQQYYNQALLNSYGAGYYGLTTLPSYGAYGAYTPYLGYPYR
jgi:hypothetical protein